MPEMAAVNLVWSQATLLSGGLESCPTSLAEKCVGGMASVSAVMREHQNRTGERSLYIPEIDRHSPFVQMHPSGWNVNHDVISDRFGWSFFVSPPSLLSDPRDLALLRTHDMPLLFTNVFVPPSNKWQHFTEVVHFDEDTGLAVLLIVHDNQPNTWATIPSALGALDYVALTNTNGPCYRKRTTNFGEGGGWTPCWTPVVVFDMFVSLGFEDFVAALAGHDNPPALIFSTEGSSDAVEYQSPKLIGQTWVASVDQSSNRAHRFRIELELDELGPAAATNLSATERWPLPTASNVTLAVHNLMALAPELKDEMYMSDQEYLRSLAIEAAQNDPVVGLSGFMPLTRDDSNLRACMGGECPIGNLFNDAFRWATGSDISFTPSGGLRGLGWDAGEVRVSDLWAAHPFVNTLCIGTLSGVSIFKILDFAASVATFQSTYTPMGDRLLQVAGLRYSYNTLIEGEGMSRLISVDVWNETLGEYRPLERLQMYKVATESWMCGAFNPFPELFRGVGIKGEVPAAINDMDHKEAVARYLKNLEGTYDTALQGRLRNDTGAWEPMNFVQLEDNCPPDTFWEEDIQTCSECPGAKAGKDGTYSHISFSDEKIELVAPPGGSNAEAVRLVLSNREVFDVAVIAKTRPDWIQLESASDGLIDVGTGILARTTLRAGESTALDLIASSKNLEVGTAQGVISFGLQGLGQAARPGCANEHDISVEVLMRVIPPAELNQLGSLRAFGISLMAVTMLLAIGFAMWTFTNRTKKVVKASQPLFLIVLCVGVFVMSSALMPLSIDDQIVSQHGCNIACMATPWLASTGFCIAFSALFSKVWRINRITKSAKKFRKVVVTERDVLTPFAIMFASNFLLLLLWTLIDPMRWVRIPVNEGGAASKWNTYGTCQLGAGDASIVLAVLIVLVDFGALLLTCYQSYIARGLSDDYAESKYIGIAVVSWVQLVMVGVPVLFLVDDNPTASYFLRSSLLFVTCMSMLLLIFLPKMRIKVSSLSDSISQLPSITLWRQSSTKKHTRSGLESNHNPRASGHQIDGGYSGEKFKDEEKVPEHEELQC